MELKIDENIVLKSFTVDDAEERYDIIDKNREFLKKWLGWLDFYHSKQDVIDFTKVCLNNEKNKISLPLAIYYNGKFAGSIELKDNECLYGKFLDNYIYGMTKQNWKNINN